MKISVYATFAALALATVMTAPAQAAAQTSDKPTVGQDLKGAGHDTADASKTVAHKTASGTRTATHKTVRGTRTVAGKTKTGTVKAADKTADVSKEGYHKTVNGTKKVGDKIAGKPTSSSTDPR